MDPSECDPPKKKGWKKRRQGGRKEKEEYGTRRKIRDKTKGHTSEGNVHVVVASKGFVTVGTLARARCQPFFHTILAEDMSTSLDSGVFEVATADSAQSKSLEEKGRLAN